MVIRALPEVHKDRWRPQKLKIQNVITITVFLYCDFPEIMYSHLVLQSVWCLVPLQGGGGFKTGEEPLRFLNTFLISVSTIVICQSPALGSIRNGVFNI